jgi:two-component system, cell cycle sensor histidine kinase and response regulator CckA
VTSRQRSDANYQRLFEHHPQAMWVFDPESLRFLAVNEAAVATYGYARDEFLAMTIADIRLPEDTPALEEALRNASRQLVSAGVWRHRKKDGSLIDVKITSNAIEFEGHESRLVLAEDITAQSQLEEQLQQAQKMEAIGNVAGGIAHDFNNILLVIRGYSSALLDELPVGPQRSSVEQIDHAAERGAEFTHQLLAFSRQQVLDLEILDVNALVAEMTQMLGRMLGENIRVDLQLEPRAAPILIDRGRLARAILNLVVNARDAMAGGGTLTIRTANVELDEAYASRHDGVVPGPHVLLQVTDSGVGMDAPTQARAFEPFFTTKEQGTGFGLATVFGLVKQRKGSISLESEPQLGTTFRLYFPSAHDGAAPVVERPAMDSLEGTETILLVEDSEAVRSLVSRMLANYGYTVVTADGGVEALELAKRRPGSIDVLMTDVVMPRMTGHVLAEKILALDPRVRVLFTSGFPADTSFPNRIVGARYGFIEKPYLAADLARKLREVLD